MEHDGGQQFRQSSSCQPLPKIMIDARPRLKTWNLKGISRFGTVYGQYQQPNAILLKSVIVSLSLCDKQ
jgi:hypothetical protein